MKKINCFNFFVCIILMLGTVRSQVEIKDYYKEICFKTEWGGAIKPAKYKKPIKIYVAGVKSQELNHELYQIVMELNILIESIDVSITNDRLESNMLVYFGTPENYMHYIDDYSDAERLEENLGLFSFYRTGFDRSEIKFSEVFVNTIDTRNKVQQKHLLREELTQALGFPNDSYKYEDSIFQQRWTEVTEYSILDKEIIRLHYNR